MDNYIFQYFVEIGSGENSIAKPDSIGRKKIQTTSLAT
jgi:hypothetical protein